jgi:hypothetical protein
MARRLLFIYVYFSLDVSPAPREEPAVTKPEVLPAKHLPEKAQKNVPDKNQRNVPEKVQKNLPEKLQKNAAEKVSKPSAQSKQQPAPTVTSTAGKKAQEKKVQRLLLNRISRKTFRLDAPVFPTTQSLRCLFETLSHDFKIILIRLYATQNTSTCSHEETNLTFCVYGVSFQVISPEEPDDVPGKPSTLVPSERNKPAGLFMQDFLPVRTVTAFVTVAFST